MSKYDYKPLNQRSREIRLLILEDLSEHTDSAVLSSSTRLRCRMIVTSLAYYSNKFENKILGSKSAIPTAIWGLNASQKFVRRIASGSPPEFHALSYVWGKSARVCDIVIDDGIVQIPINLAEALTSIYMNTDIRIIWADALCINQDDTSEKSWQVREMATIYTRATSVVSWLGPKNKHTTAAFDALRPLRKESSSDEFSLRDLLQSKKTAPSVFHQAVRKLLQNSEQWTAVLHMANSPYWTRMWIFQELACAHTKLFLWGNRTMLNIDGTLASLLNHLQESAKFDTELWATKCIPMIRTTHDLYFRDVPAGYKPDDQDLFLPRLLNLLRRLSSLEATDTRDRIFALLSIAHDRGRLCLTPDYSKSVDTVLKETACAILQDKQLGILLDAVRSNQRLELPSWTPDWSMMTRAKLESKLYQLHKYPHSTPSVHLEIDGNTISFDAYTVDDVVLVGQPYRVSRPVHNRDSSTVNIEDNLTFKEWLALTEAVVWDHEKYVKGKREEDARTKKHIMMQLLSAATVGNPGLRRLPRDPQKNTILDFYDIISNANSLKAVESALRSSSSTSESSSQFDYLAAVKRVFVQDSAAYPFKTETGYSCLGFHWQGQVGDRIIIVSGVELPLIVRRCPNQSEPGPGKETYFLCGMAYVHGIMDTEFFYQKPLPVKERITLR